MAEQSGPPDSHNADAPPRALDPIPPTLDARWLMGIAVTVPLLVAAGAYWLHQLPSGPHQEPSGMFLDVQVLRDAEEVQEQALVPEQAQSMGSEGQPDTLLPTPERPIPEDAQEADFLPPPSTATLKAAFNKTPTANVDKKPQIPSGMASTFQRALFQHIARFRRYPKNAGPGMRGVTQVLFSMRRDGTVAEVWVRTSSGNLVLDDAATDTIHRAQPLPAIPTGLPDRLTVLVPVFFGDK